MKPPAAANGGRKHPAGPRAADYRVLVAKLAKLRARLRKLERSFVQPLARIHPSYRASARNLVHYIALRRHDIRRLQRRLSAAGVSSLGNSEAAVLANLNAVIGVLRSVAGSNGGGAGREADYRPPVAFDESRDILKRHTRALLGREPRKRSTRIMVTLPTEAATDRAFVTELVRHGMDCARINCAHDTPDDWIEMARNVRRASKQLKLPCRIQMDLGGPKLRTGRIEPGPAVVKWRPVRDRLGRVLTPANVLLRTRGLVPLMAADLAVAATLTLPRRFIARLAVGDTIRFRDARGASRALVVTVHGGTFCVAEARSTAYVTNGTRFRVRRRGKKPLEVTLSGIPREEQGLLLQRGHHLVLSRNPIPGRPIQLDEAGRVTSPAAISCTLPRALAHAKRGEAVWFDDGRIGGTIEEVHPDHVVVRITQAAKEGGDRLRAGRGINLPDTRLDVDAMTRRDMRDLAVVAEHADIVGLSFVRRVDDVRRLQARLGRAGGRCRGIMLKVETRKGFELLPELILAAMSSPAIGIMIARGDLAVECGYERLAEVQEEVLWICEAAHVPVVWATQVLESAAKLGQPSRPEITDAAMSERAECVMLNKGPHILGAVDLLDRILRRMEAHQHKKRAMLRRLHWWTRVQKRIESWQAEPGGNDGEEPHQGRARVRRAVRRHRRAAVQAEGR